MRKTLFAAGVLAGLCAFPTAHARPERDLHRIGHIIVISLENHSFDNLFGNFPLTDGLKQAGAHVVQLDAGGKPYDVLPPFGDTRFPSRLPNAPFAIDDFVPADTAIPDPVHSFYKEQAQIDGGRMDHFASVSNVGGLVMGYYDASHTALWRYAQQYTLADHFFHAAFGGSFLNHLWLICACTPSFENAPADLVSQLDDKGNAVKEGAVTPDGYAVNTLFATDSPHPAGADAAHLLPPQTMPTIGDRLSEKGIGWAWYSGGWNDAVAGRPAPSFQFHHQPFAYFAAYADGTAARKAHLKDESDFLEDVARGTLPAVAFYKPLGEFSLHPGYTDVASGDAHIAEILQAIQTSSIWSNTVVIVTFDENGGFWDHVPPPRGDRFGPGVRVPTIIVSPFARQGFVDHTIYDTTSILKLIETRFDLAPLGTRDAQAADLTAALLF